jgi:hypothetical protein
MMIRMVSDIAAADVARWCDWADTALASPGPAVLVQGDLHGDNQVWEMVTSSGWWWTSRPSEPPSRSMSCVPSLVRGWVPVWSC